MSAWIFMIGLVMLWAGMSSRLARRERRSLELAALNYPIKVAAFWGRDAKAERQAYFDKFEEHKNWRNNLVGPFIIAVVGIYYVYQLMKRLDKAESEIRWLNLLLEQIKDNGQVNYSELERRIDRLKGK
jgi:hypothetical protein